MALLLEQLLNGMQFGVFLFLVSAGLTLVLGIMNVVNLAHGSLYMLGAYFAATFYAWTGSLWFAFFLMVKAEKMKHAMDNHVFQPCLDSFFIHFCFFFDLTDTYGNLTN